ncbi:MAG TPA: shikimate kinase [Pyrinomonadaceae bacterium]|nr:shikimate kinase [Pyrinomonadaceae bacterium]
MNRRIVIIGFMGCGKTTVGEALARRLERNFTDLDSFITKREGRSPAEIIQTDGEASFREIETLALHEALADLSAQVIALGGGTWTTPANRTLIALHNCFSVWLDAPFELCWQRIAGNLETVRPMAPDYDTARKRFALRRPDYALVECCIRVSNAESAETLAAQILAQPGVSSSAP